MKQTDFDALQKGWAVKQRIFNKEPIGFQGMAINLRKPQFQDVRVRRALNMLLNREAMNEKYMYNQYFLLNSYYPDLWEGNQNPTAPLYKFNPDSARALFAEAGYKVNAQGVLEKDGKPFAINFITSQEDLRHLTLFQEDLKKVGVVATIEQMSQSTLRKRLDDADFDLYWVNWGAGRLRDPEASWNSTTALQKGTNNLAGVQDKVVDSLINLQKTEFDLAKRNEILKALESTPLPESDSAEMQVYLNNLALWNRRAYDYHRNPEAPRRNNPCGGFRSYDMNLVPSVSLEQTERGGLAQQQIKASAPWVPAASQLPQEQPTTVVNPNGATLPAGTITTYTGYINVPDDGNHWHFYLTLSNVPGSKAFVKLHNFNLIDADFNYAPGTTATESAAANTVEADSAKTGKKGIPLRAGLHPITITVVQGDSADGTLKLEWNRGPHDGAQTERLPIPAEAFLPASR